MRPQDTEIPLTGAVVKPQRPFFDGPRFHQRYTYSYQVVGRRPAPLTLRNAERSKFSFETGEARARSWPRPAVGASGAAGARYGVDLGSPRMDLRAQAAAGGSRSAGSSARARQNCLARGASTDDRPAVAMAPQGGQILRPYRPKYIAKS